MKMAPGFLHNIARLIALLSVLLAASYALPQSAVPHGKSEKAGGEADEHDSIIERQKWFMQGRTTPDGSAPAAMLHRAFAQRQELIRQQRAAAQNGAQSGLQPLSAGMGPAWQPVGPAPIISDPSGFQDYGYVSGRVTALAVDQSDSSGNTVYVGGAYGGVWKSTNAGPATAGNPNAVTWIPLTDDQATLAVGAIAVSPDGNTVLVGTGESDFAIDSYYGFGILRSTSRGAPGSWTLISSSNVGPFSGLGFSKIAFNTNSPSLVVAAAGSTIGFGLGLGAPRGLYYSTNGGASWNLASVTDFGTSVVEGSITDLVFNRANNTFYAAYRFHGFYQSTDGANWSRLPNQPDPVEVTTSICTTSSANPGCPMARGALAFNPGTGELFAWFVDANNTNKGIWRTTNGGASAWSQLNTGGIDSCGDGAGCGTQQGFYDLYLSAVPGINDLYAGAVNLYKLPSGQSNFINLTHVYGCSPRLATTAHMHPDYHAQDFLQSNPNIIFFGNDGGVYRTLNGSGMTVGTCNAGTNPVENLNLNMGSLTQFISFSQHPSNPAIILGGTQDNGSPASTAAGSGNTTWSTVNGGDGGFNEIDPVDPFNILTSNTDVSISYCRANSGDPTCVFQTFNPLVSVGRNFPDHGDFYTPYMLDPADHTKIIIGTCRVWRGSATNSSNWGSSSFSNALSNQLETGSTAACGSSMSSYVSALAAGGPNFGNGSNVIYAGFSDGRIFVTTNANFGLASFVERTFLGGPRISSIAVDSSDPSGNTAYATLMSFGVPHVIKTTNAGASWSNLSSNLPNAPADSIVVNQQFPSTLYVGTDVGVFVSADGGASWSAYGQFFPNVVVNKLRIFGTGPTALLRASTHGRGVWQIATSDYALSISNSVIQIFPGQGPVPFNGTLTSINNYNALVNISCQGGSVPATCNGTSATPTASFSVTADAPTPNDYNFNIVGVGADSSHLSHQQAVLLRVIDFSVGAPSAGTLTTYPTYSSPSVATSFALTPLGQFNQVVSLSCGGLPTGAVCNFAPSSNVFLSPNNPVMVTMTVATTSTPGGSYNLTISANTAFAPAPKTQSVNLVVQDFALSFVPSQQAVFPGQSAMYNGTFTPINGYSGSYNVSLSCVAGSTPGPQTCSLVPATVNTGSPSSALTTSHPTVADLLFNVQGIGNDPGATVHLQPVIFRVVDFNLGPLSPGSITMSDRNVSAPITIPLIPRGSFNFPVTVNCSGLPSGATCRFNNVAAPATFTPEGTTLPLSLTVVANGINPPPPFNGSITVTADSNPHDPSGPFNKSFMLTVNAPSGTTDLSIADGAPEAIPIAHQIGKDLAFALTAGNNGSPTTGTNVYVTFPQVVWVKSATVTGGSCPGVPELTSTLVCNIGSMTATDSRTVLVTVDPGFIRSVTATAVIDSDAADSDLTNNVVSITRQVRPRPLAIRNLPARLP